MRTHTTEKYLLNPQHPVTINVIGCGGTGSQVIMQLARVNEALKKLGHIGIHVTCFDADIVTEANLGRQLFSQSELGMSKSVAIITRINRFFSTSWTALPAMYTSGLDAELLKANITISCVDSIVARKKINAILKNQKSMEDPLQKAFYWMDFGNTQNAGQFILGTLKSSKSKLPCLFEKFPTLVKQKEKKSGPSCSLAEALEKQDLFINSTLAQLGTNLLWKLFREGKITYQGAFINLQTLKIATINI